MKFTCILIFIFFLGLLSPCFGQTMNPDDANWDSRFSPCNVDTRIYTMIKTDSLFIVGGDSYYPDYLVRVQGKSMRQPLVWNGHFWSTLGQGIDGIIKKLLQVGDSIYAVSQIDN